MKGDKIKIVFDGKEIEVTEYAPGAVQKTTSIFYIRDCVSGEYLYCFPARMEKLMAKNNGDLSGFKGRATKAAERKAAQAVKRAEKEAKKAEAASKASAEPSKPLPVHA